MTYVKTGPYVDYPPSATTPVMAAHINHWETTLAEIESGLGLPASRYLTGVGDETAAFQQWIDDACDLSGSLPQGEQILVGQKGLTVSISGTIDMRAHGLRYVGNGMKVFQTADNTGAVMVGGFSQIVTGLYIEYETQGPYTDTASIGVQLFAGFQCYYADWQVDKAVITYAIGQSDWDGTGQNTIFSCLFENINALGWSNRVLDMRTYPNAGASSTGNVFSNFYLHNNVSGPALTAETPIYFTDWDESHFEQINVEWCIFDDDDVWFMQRCRNFTMDSLHFEGLQLHIARGILRLYENCSITVRGMTFTNSTLQTGATTSILRIAQPTDAPCYADIRGLRVRQMTGTPTAMCLVDLATDGTATTSRVTIDQFSTIDAATVGELVLGDNPYSPVVQQINDSFYGGRAADPNQLYRLQPAFSRDLINSQAGTFTSGTVRLSYFTAKETRAYTQLRTWSGTTPAAATPSTFKLGLYTVAANGTITLVARTANQTGALAVANTQYTYAMATAGGFPATYTAVAGQRYVLAQIIVTAATAPSLTCQTVISSPEALLTPPICANISGQTDLPTSIILANQVASTTRSYMVLVP